MTEQQAGVGVANVRSNYTLEGLATGDIEFLREAALDGGRFELAGRIIAAMRPAVKAPKPKPAKPPVKRAAKAPIAGDNSVI